MGHSLYVPLDVDFPSDPKFLRAGPVAGYLYFVSLALIKRTKSDGIIASEQLATLCVGFPGKPDTHAARLVEAGLWEPVEGGWTAPAYLKRNPARAQVEEKSERKRLASVKANHDRWHSDGKRSDDCPHCIRPPSDFGGPPDPVASPSPKPETEPEPETAPLRREPSSSGTSAARSNDDDRTAAATRTLAERALTRREAEVGPVANRGRWLAAATEARRREHADAAGRLLEIKPDLTADQLADLLEPVGEVAKPHPLDEAQQAQYAAMVDLTKQPPPWLADDLPDEETRRREVEARQAARRSA